MLYSLSFMEWNVKERLKAMEQCGIKFDRPAPNMIEVKDIGMSSGEREAFDFLRDPVHPVKFHIFDYSYGRIILKLHSEFWAWKFKL